VRVIRSLLESAETNRPVSLPQMKITPRPDSSQEISKKPVAKRPELAAALGATPTKNSSRGALADPTWLPSMRTFRIGSR